MCFSGDPAVKSAVHAALDKFTSDNAVFSAHDITTQVRKDLGAQVKVSHGDVREILRDAMRDNLLPDNYFSSLHRFDDAGGNSVAALIYHPDDKDVTSYDPNWLRGVVAATTPAVAPISAPVVTSPGVVLPKAVPGDGSTQVDKRGRLCIRSSDVASIYIFDIIYLFKTTNGDVILSGGIPGDISKAIGNYKVDASGNVRIGSDTLYKCGFNNCGINGRTTDRYFVKQNNGNLVITAAN